MSPANVESLFEDLFNKQPTKGGSRRKKGGMPDSFLVRFLMFGILGLILVGGNYQLGDPSRLMDIMVPYAETAITYFTYDGSWESYRGGSCDAPWNSGLFPSVRDQCVGRSLITANILMSALIGVFGTLISGVVKAKSQASGTSTESTIAAIASGDQTQALTIQADAQDYVSDPTIGLNVLKELARGFEQGDGGTIQITEGLKEAITNLAVDLQKILVQQYRLNEADAEVQLRRAIAGDGQASDVLRLLGDRPYDGEGGRRRKQTRRRKRRAKKRVKRSRRYRRR